MTTFFLVRHCAVQAHGRYLAGRAPREHLSDEGRAQAQRLGECFTGVSLDSVCSSPLERARETAAMLASCTPSGVQFADELLEIEFGEWTGKTFDALSHDPRWAQFNADRATTRIPGGESMTEVQSRIVTFLDRLATEQPTARIAVVSHGDVLRAAICFYIGLSLNRMQQVEIAPGGVCILEHDPNWTVLRAMNVISPTPANLGLA